MGRLSLVGWMMPLLAAAGWLWWIYTGDHFEREPWGLVLRTAGLGALAGLMALLLGTLLPGRWPHTPLDLIGITAAMALLPWRSGHWNEGFDGLVYGGAAGIGYGLIFTLPGLVVDSAVGYRIAAFSLPVYMMSGLVLGHFMSRTRFSGDRLGWVKGLLSTGLFLLGIEFAVAAGGEVVSGPNMMAGLLAYGSNMLAWIFATRAMDESHLQSPSDFGAAALMLGTVACARCGSPSADGARFCHGCGQPLQAQREA